MIEIAGPLDYKRSFFLFRYPNKSNTHIILFIIAINITIEVLNYVSDRIQYLIIRLIKYSLLLIYSLGRIPDVTFVMQLILHSSFVAE